MKKNFKVILLILIVAGAFLAGYWLNSTGGKAGDARKILYYIDPMNPAFRSDKPGIAPCGMPLEPVYADASGGADLRSALPPGTIRISPEKQQLIGVKTMTVEKAPWTHTLRVLGRVTPDETLVFRINAATDGWIEKTMPVTTGSQVRKNELLATLSFFSLEYRTLVQNYFNLFNLGQAADQGLEALANNPQYSEPQLRQMRKAARFAGDITDSSQIEYYRKSLYNYGISPYQLDEMERTRTFPEVVEIRAPAAGFILFRNVSTGLRLDRGAELFRVADLSRVWILADIFENEASFFKPGIRVKMELPYQKKIFYARVSPVLPQFDPATRTFKVRLVADNPGFVLRPDMFVNVELSVSGPASIIVPVDAVLDSGLKKTVFLDRGSGILEARQVETGRILSDRVEIVGGLMPGEKIVVSGNFLLDSEARMQQAASGIAGNVGLDLVCRMNVDENRARAEGKLREYKGKTYFFCSTQCRDDFGREPERYLKAPSGTGSMSMPASPEGAARHAREAAAKRPSPTPSAASKPGGVKAAPAPAGMPMSAVQAPAATPEVPGEIAPPAASPRSPRTNLRMQRYRQPGSGPQEGTQESAPIWRPIFRGPAPPAAEPGINQALPPFPGPGAMPTPGSPGTAPPSGPGAGPMFPPATSLPDMSPGTPSFPGPGGVSLPQGPARTPGSPDAAPMPGSPDISPIAGPKAGETPPPAAEAPR
jgi:RND family efflux transporter MFP subunit